MPLEVEDHRGVDRRANNEDGEEEAICLHPALFQRQLRLEVVVLHQELEKVFHERLLHRAPITINTFTIQRPVKDHRHQPYLQIRQVPVIAVQRNTSNLGPVNALHERVAHAGELNVAVEPLLESDNKSGLPQCHHLSAGIDEHAYAC